MDQWPVLEKYFSLRDLKTQEQVDRYALSQLNDAPVRMNKETTVALKNIYSWDVNTFIPGVYANVSSKLCFDLSGNYRLCNVSFDIVKDTVSLGFV